MDNVIEAVKVSKIYDMGEIKVTALNDVSLMIKRGEFVSITGPSGSGKTTLLDILSALSRPSKGEVLINGDPISQMTDSELALVRGKTIGFVFQSFNLIPRLTAMENVMLPMWFANIGDRESRAENLLKRVGLGHRLDNKPSQLSGGEMQRVATARALANNPDIIV